MLRDLTYGKPMKLILSFGIPIFLGLLFQQFYNMADTAIVGQYLGGNALASVGSTGSVNFLVLGFVNGISSGFAIPIAQQKGAGNYSELRKYVTGSMYLCIFFSAVLTALTVVYCGDILTLMKTPDDIYVGAKTYISTIFMGIPTFFLYNMCAGILRSLGDSKTPVIWLVIASVINIGLDLMLIIVFKKGIFGAAFATVSAQLISGIGCLIRIIRGFPDILKMERADFHLSLRRAGTLLSMGLPMGLQFSITAIGSIVLQSAVNTLGTSYVTAVTAAQKLSIMFCCPFDAMGSTMATYGGQNVGAKKLDRLGEGLKCCGILGICYAVFAFIVLFLFGGTLVRIFLDEKSLELIPLVRKFLVIQAAFYIPLAFVNIVRLLIQGMGFSPIATFAGVLEMAARSVLAYLVVFFGFNAVCLASPSAWILADLFLFPAFFICRKVLYKRLESTDKNS